MITNEEIVKRFFEVLDYLVERRKLKSIGYFAGLVGSSRGVFTRLREEPGRNLFKVHWIAYLCKHFNISPEYILTGEGDMELE